MRGLRFELPRFAIISIFVFGLLFGLPAKGDEGRAPFLVTQAVNNDVRVTLRGSTHPLARAEFDRGTAPDDLPLRRMLLLLKRSPEQQLALAKLLDEQQTKSSPNYHHWLTPEEFGEQFGPAVPDVQAVTDWLTSEGFVIEKVSAGRSVVEFSGTAGQVRSALHTEIHKFVVNGRENWANAGDPQIPSALAPVVAGFVSLNNFPRKPMSRTLGPFSRSEETGQIQPMYTLSYPDVTYYIVGPTDFATIYNVSPLWQAGLDGSGQTIAIVAESNINLNDPQAFRSMWNLPYKPPQIILNGPDPGVIPGPETEATLDVQWAGAVAKGANIALVVSESTEASSGIDLSSLYIIDYNLAPIMSVSYGGCEENLGEAGNAFFNSLWQQGSAEGITILVSTGDSGSDVCDYSNINLTGWATTGLSVNALASTPFNVAVGGTDFNDLANPSTYWSSTNNTTTHASAKSYIPEMTWNSGCASRGLTGCANLVGRGLDLLAGSGGPSSCSQFSGGECAGGYPKPPWQTGVGVPNDGVRDLPDISLFGAIATATNSFYPYCEADQLDGYSCSFTGAFLGAGGTSVSAQAFAGIVAMLLQKTGERQGNLNFVLYPLAARSGASCSSNSTSVGKASCIFYDTITGNNSVACISGSPNCSKTTAGTGYGVLVDPDNSSKPAWMTTAGFDLATGLGTVNAANMVNGWSSVSFGSTTTTLSLSTTPPTNPLSVVHGQPVNFDVGVTASSGTPTGSVSLVGGPNNTSPSVGFATLSSGAASGATVFLPGGTYGVTAHYAGDGTFGSSDSTPPIQVTVTPEASTTKVGLVTFDFDTGQITSTNATSAPYGSFYLLRLDVTNASGKLCAPDGGIPQYACPSGQVTVTDNGAPLDLGTYVLNSQGYTEDQAIQLPGGAHPVVANYSGDANYNSNTKNQPISITPAPTTLTLGTVSSVFVGQSLNITARMDTKSSGVRPSGEFQIYNGTTSIPSSGNYSGAGGGSNYSAYLLALLQTGPFSGGTLNIMAKYPGDTNYAAVTSDPVTVKVVDFGVAVSPTTLSIPAPGQSASTTVTVTPLYGFTGWVDLYCNALVSTPGMACTPSPSTVYFSDSTPRTATITVTSTAPYTSVRSVRHSRVLSVPLQTLNWPCPTALLALAGVFLIASILIPAGRRGAVWRSIPALAGAIVALVVAGVWMSCGGGGGGGGGGGSSPPKVSLSTTSLSFGSQAVGSAGTAQAVTLSSTGGSNLLISSITIGGANSYEFQESSNCGAFLSVGSICTINVKYVPRFDGPVSAVLLVNDNAAGGQQSVALSGTGIRATGTVSPASMTFGEQVIGTTSPEQIATLSNTGPVPITISNIRLQNSNPPDFQQTNDCGSSLASGANCLIHVTFSPTIASPRYDYIFIDCNANGVSYSAVYLSGTGLPPPTPPGNYSFNVVANAYQYGSDATRSQQITVTVQ